MKYLLALIPIIGASALLWGQPYSNYNLLSTNYPSVTDLLWRSTNMTYATGTFTVATLIHRLPEIHIGKGPTNIVVSNDYSGTIQIGTNFATIKELDTWMQVLGGMKRSDESLVRIANVHPSVTYTVNVADGIWKHTNVIDIHKCSEFCTRMRYVENGVTNDFHAAFASFTVITNSP